MNRSDWNHVVCEMLWKQSVMIGVREFMF